MPDETYSDDDIRNGDEETLVRADLAAVTLTVGGKKITDDISHMELDQSVDAHHIARITIRERGAETRDKAFVDATKYTEFLGKISLIFHLS